MGGNASGNWDENADSRGEPPMSMGPTERAAYLTLLTKTLTRLPLSDSDWERLPALDRVDASLTSPIRAWASDSRFACCDASDLAVRRRGRDWPADAETMIGLRRLAHLGGCAARALRDGVAGDFVETGVWRGGACLLMRAVLAAHGDTSRVVWLADSFEGLPRPRRWRYPKDHGSALWQHRELAIPLEVVEQNFRRYGLLDGQVRFLPGWFRDTLTTAPIERIALLRLDGDMYESTIVALESLYPRVSAGGFVVVDDYGALEACRAAVSDFRRARRIEAPIRRIDDTGVYWRVHDAAA